MIKPTRPIAPVTLGVIPFISLAAIGVSTAATTAPPYIVPENGIVATKLNGHPVRLTVQADGLSYPVLNPETARRLSLRNSILSVQARVGSETVPGHTGQVTLDLADASAKQRSLWFERAITTSTDGAVGPQTLAAPIVTFRIAEPRPGERQFILPLVTKTNRLGTSMKVNGSEIFIVWSLQRRDTLATAAAASDLAAAYDGKLHGDRMLQPIRFGITRPVRGLRFGQLLAIGPLRINNILARTSDYGSTGTVLEQDQDVSEIIVTGKGRKGKIERILTVGRDALSHCSSLTFDKAAGKIILTCLPATPI